MITEKDKEAASRKKIENATRLCEESLEKAEKYERLKENKDWQGHLEDLKILISSHEREISLAVSMLPDAPNTGYLKHDANGQETYVSSKLDWIDFIGRHEIMRASLATFIKEPDYMMEMASLAREKLPLLKKSLQELSHEPVASGSNGAE